MSKINFQQSLVKTVSTVLCVVALSMPATLSYAAGAGGTSAGGGKVSDNNGADSNGGSGEFRVKSAGGATPTEANAHPRPNFPGIIVNPRFPGTAIPTPAAPVTAQNSDSCSKTQHDVAGATDQVICDETLRHE